jgi:hypothetical protein
MTILECLSNGNKSYSELSTLTEIPASTLKRQLRVMIEIGNINHDGKVYKITKSHPNGHDIAEQMVIIFQQKNMDRNFRKLPLEQKSDSILEWYMNHGLRGRIDDFFEGDTSDGTRNTLLNSIHEGFNLFLSRNKLPFNTHAKSNKVTI